MAKPKALAVIAADKPLHRHFTADDRRQALDLLASGLSFRETLATLPFHVSIGVLHYWWIASIAGLGASAMAERVALKIDRLRMFYVLAAEELAACSVEMARDGNGKGAQGAMIASGIAIDKAQILDGKPSSLKYGRYDIVHGHTERLDHGNDDSIHLIEAARTPDDAVTDVE